MVFVPFNISLLHHPTCNVSAWQRCRPEREKMTSNTFFQSCSLNVVEVVLGFYNGSSFSLCEYLSLHLSRLLSYSLRLFSLSPLFCYCGSLWLPESSKKVFWGMGPRYGDHIVLHLVLLIHCLMEDFCFFFLFNVSP